MEELHTDHGCAEYLRKHYIIPQTYRRSTIVPAAAIATVALFALFVPRLWAIFMMALRKEGPYADSFVLATVGIMIVLLFLFALVMICLTFQGTTISSRTFEIKSSLFFGKTIQGSLVSGYAIDTIRLPKSGATVPVIAIVHDTLEKKNVRTQLRLEVSALNEPKFRGLLQSMRNFGAVPLDDVLEDLNSSTAAGGFFNLLLLIGMLLWGLWCLVPGFRHIFGHL
jgi:hypothetical protein